MEDFDLVESSNIKRLHMNKKELYQDLLINVFKEEKLKTFEKEVATYIDKLDKERSKPNVTDK